MTQKNRKQAAPVINLEMHGKLPPQAVDIEKSLLSAYLSDNSHIAETIEYIPGPEAFYLESSQIIYRAIMSLYKQNRPADLVTIVAYLKQEGTLDQVGGAFYISEITNAHYNPLPGAYNDYAKQVHQKYILRKLLEHSVHTAKLCYDDSLDSFEMINEIVNKTSSIINGVYNNKPTAMPENVQKVYDALAAAKNNKNGNITGLPTLLSSVDKITAGLQNGDLIILAARPAMGKTALSLAIAKNIAMQGHGVVYFSLEMTKMQLTKRLLSQESGVPLQNIIRANLDTNQETEISKAGERLSNCPLFIDETPAINPMQLKAKAQALKLQHDVKLIVVDYLQLMQPDGKQNNREGEINQISRTLKAIAKDLDVPIIALSQLNRAVESRGGDKRPLLSDLRESGAIEQDADIVVFVYRPEYYQITEGADGQPYPQNYTEAIFAKHRNGDLAIAQLKFINWCQQFKDLNYNSLEGPENSTEKISSNTNFLSDKNDDDEPF